MGELRQLVPEGATLAQLALRWILMFPEVSAAIPGAKTPAQAEQNVQATRMPVLDPRSGAGWWACRLMRVHGLSR